MELKIEAIEEGNNAKKGVANLGIFKEEKVVEVAMEIQAKSLEVTTNVLEKMNILVRKTKKNVPTIQVNTNKEQTKEEVVNIGVKQPEKEIQRGKMICTKMVEKEFDKPTQVNESQMSLFIIMVMLGVGK